MDKLTPSHLILLNQKIMEDNGEVLKKDGQRILNEIVKIPYERDSKDKISFYLYKGTMEKAMKLGCLIVENEPFLDGNEETAVLAMLTLLKINGYKLKNYKGDIDELCEYLRNQDMEAGYRWIDRHVEENLYVDSVLKQSES